MLNVSSDYSQFYAGSYKTIWVDVNFKSPLYLTHVTYHSKFFSAPWKYATNFSISGTTELNQTLTVFRNIDPNYLNKIEPVVIPIRPGIYKSIRIEQYDLSIDFFVIRYLDLFGAICDPVSLCYGNPLDIICSCPVQYFHTSLFEISPYIILFLA